MTLKLNSAGIIGIGYHVPEKILTNADIEKLVDTNDEWITERKGHNIGLAADIGQALGAGVAEGDGGVFPVQSKKDVFLQKMSQHQN